MRRAVITADKCLLFEPSSPSSRKFLDLVTPKLHASAALRLRQARASRCAVLCRAAPRRAALFSIWGWAPEGQAWGPEGPKARPAAHEGGVVAAGRGYLPCAAAACKRAARDRRLQARREEARRVGGSSGSSKELGGGSAGSSGGSYDEYDAGEDRIFPFELELVEGALMVATGQRARLPLCGGGLPPQGRLIALQAAPQPRICASISGRGLCPQGPAVGPERAGAGLLMVWGPGVQCAARGRRWRSAALRSARGRLGLPGRAVE